MSMVSYLNAKTKTPLYKMPLTLVFGRLKGFGVGGICFSKVLGNGVQWHYFSSAICPDIACDN